MATPPRLKTHWFKPVHSRNPAQTGSAVASTAWRVAGHLIGRLREAGFDIDPGAQYFGVMREFLVFLLACADRIAHARLDLDARREFTTAMVVRVAQILEENEAGLLGPIEGESYADLFVRQFNVVCDHYAEFGWTDDEGPDFGFVRYLGHRLEPLMPDKDRHWVLDQVGAIEAPLAVEMLESAMSGVLSDEPGRPRRSAMTGD